ncbi:MAG: trypsin-like peptidase domain-containing protein [Oscillospiraceae bacterium]|nr:trypsin-like peptidase domain-containing protein [Oscillospiraceae bacterium]
MDINDRIFSDGEEFSAETGGEQVNDSLQPSYDTPSIYEEPPVFEERFSASSGGFVSEEAPVKKVRGKGWKTVGAVAAALVLVAGSSFATAAVMNARMDRQVQELTDEFGAQMQELRVNMAGQVSVIPGTYTAEGEAVYNPAQVYELCKRSVVGVTNQYTATTGGSMFPFGGGGTTTAVSTGSGFVLTESGYVVTNYHVIENCEKLTVTLYDGTTHEATLIGGDENCDIALLKIEAEGLYPVTVGNSDRLLIGDQVVAIGNPLGELTSTQTVGYISGKDREVSTDGTVINMLQTDAAINSGNSGGPLFNMHGQVVGITTAKYSGTSTSGASIEGIGFAIPISDVIGMFEDLQEFGYITGAYLGVMVRDFDSSTAAMYNLPVGAYVESVTEGSCAEKGGMRAQDIIIGLGGYEVTDRNSLSRALRKFKAGDQVEAVVFRGGTEVTLTLVLDEKPQDTAVPQETLPNMPSEGNFEDWYNYFSPFFGN